MKNKIILLLASLVFLTVSLDACNALAFRKLTRGDVQKIEKCQNLAEDFGHVVNEDYLFSTRSYARGLVHSFSLLHDILGEREYHVIVAHSDYRKWLKRPLTIFLRRKMTRHRRLVRDTSYYVCKTRYRPDLVKHMGKKWFEQFKQRDLF